MATSPETFHQVRDILKKLDRSISDARRRRLATDDAPATSQPPQPAKPGRARPMQPRRDRPEGFRPTGG